MNHRQCLKWAVAAGITLIAPLASAQQYKGEIIHPMMVTRTGPFATAVTAPWLFTVAIEVALELHVMLTCDVTSNC